MAKGRCNLAINSPTFREPRTLHDLFQDEPTQGHWQWERRGILQEPARECIVAAGKQRGVGLANGPGQFIAIAVEDQSSGIY